MGTAEINHIAFASTVPFDEFTVEISLVHEDVVGPASTDMQVYGKHKVIGIEDPESKVPLQALIAYQRSCNFQKSKK